LQRRRRAGEGRRVPGDPRRRRSQRRHLQLATWRIRRARRS
jgi:hypothetical protein